MTMNPKKTKLDWQIEQHRQELAGKQADLLVARLDLSVPIDPLKVAFTEAPLLKAGGRDFGNRFDGKLKYNREKNRFLLFYNSKYDTGLPLGQHHPRTRFSIAHELGHYFIEPHHQYLRHGGLSHASSSEFISDVQMEREADAFAASLLLPTPIIKPIVNQGDLTFERLDEVAATFETSLVSTTIRCVRLSDFPCAVAGIRGGRIAWMFPSDSLLDDGCFPGKRDIESPTGKERWEAFRIGVNNRLTVSGKARHWFQMFGRANELHDLNVAEHYLPARIMGTLIVLLTLDEEEVSPAEEEEEDEIDTEHRARFGW